MSFPNSNLHSGDRWSENNKNYEWNGYCWRENEICIPDHHWKFNECSSVTWGSDSGLIPKHLFQSGTTLGNQGKINNSGYIDNNDGTAFISESAEATTIYDLSIFAWVKLSSTTVNKMIYSRYEDSTHYFYLRLSYNEFSLRLNNVYSHAYLPSSVFNNNWQLLGGRYYNDGTDIHIDLFLNGEKINTTTVNSTTVTFSESSQAIRNKNHYIGNFSHDTSYSLNGYIEDLRVYHRKISELDIANIYNYGLGTHSQINVPGFPNRKYPVHHWKFDEDNVGFLRTSDSGTKPVLLYPAWESEAEQISGQIHNQIKFINYLSIYSIFKENETYSKWTCSFHFNTNLTSGVGIILRLSNNSSNVIRIYTNSYNELKINFKSWTSVITYNITTNTDYYFTLSYDSNDLVLYKDLASVSTYNITGQTVSYTTTDMIFIGNDDSPQGTLKVDDVKFWDYVLTEEERENEYYLFKEQKESL